MHGENRQQTKAHGVVGKGIPEGKAKSVLSSELAETPSYHQQNWTQMISLLWFI